MVTSHSKGHKIYYDQSNKLWKYLDSNEDVNNTPRSCVKCKLFSLEDDIDPCIGRLEGVKSACCGHGVETPYIIYED